MPFNRVRDVCIGCGDCGRFSSKLCFKSDSYGGEVRYFGRNLVFVRISRFKRCFGDNPKIDADTDLFVGGESSVEPFDREYRDTD
jgi:hypothetical protein